MPQCQGALKTTQHYKLFGLKAASNRKPGVFLEVQLSTARARGSWLWSTSWRKKRELLMQSCQVSGPTPLLSSWPDEKYRVPESDFWLYLGPKFLKTYKEVAEVNKLVCL